MSFTNPVGNSLTGATGTGNFVGATSPTLITPNLGTPASGTLTNCTGLPVAGGGTGVASTTAYAVLCGGTTSTGALQSIASVGTALQFLMSNGASALPTFKSLSTNVQNFSANGTYTPSAHTLYCIVIAVGGGGGSGACGLTGVGEAAASGAGGGGGFVQHIIFNPTVQTVTIGAGGIAGTAGGSGGTGGSTTLGAIVGASGGIGGSGAAGSTTFQIANGGAGGGYTVVPNLVVAVGQPGGASYYCGSIAMAIPGYGGACFQLGQSTQSGSSPGVGITGNFFGAGGASSWLAASSAAVDGAPGGPGVMNIIEYIYN